MTSATTSLILVLIRQKTTMLWELLFVSPERFVVTNGRVRKTVQLWCEIHTHSNVKKDSVLPFNTYRVMTEDTSGEENLYNECLVLVWSLLSIICLCLFLQMC